MGSAIANATTNRNSALRVSADHDNRKVRKNLRDRLLITAPPDATRSATDEAIRVVIDDDLTRGGVHAHFRTEIQDRSFTTATTDIAWSYGTGVPISRTAAEVALIRCGRNP